MLLLSIVFSLSMLSFNSCTIAGEEICGIWNANGDYGDMQVEITPWKGKFLGYLLEYSNGEETIKGDKTEDFIFITDLEYKDNKYQEGKIYLDPSSDSYCGLTIELLSENQIKAIYNCEGQTSEEFWHRKGTIAPKKDSKTPTVTHTESSSEKTISKEIKKQSTKEVTNSVDLSTKNSKVATSNDSKKVTTSEVEGETKKLSSFYLIGIQETVKYNDFKTMEKVVETLWTKAYNEDFSNKLNNITDANNMYLSYSNYDQPKGSMTITLGFKVEDLNTIPTNLHGIQIPTNEYLTYPMSGEVSDYEGEGWNQLSELMLYRKTDSVDFEIYTFDNNYNIKKVEMWIATK